MLHSVLMGKMGRIKLGKTNCSHLYLGIPRRKFKPVVCAFEFPAGTFGISQCDTYQTQARSQICISQFSSFPSTQDASLIQAPI